MKRAQNATEYLIILAVVIIIALVVVSVLRGIPGIGSGSDTKVKLAALATEEIGVTHSAFTDDWVKFELRNNVARTVKVNSLWVDQKSCASDTSFPITLGVGKSKMITCYNRDTGDEAFNDLTIEYVNTHVDATLNTQSASPSSFKGTTTSDCGGQETVSGVYDIYTCDDLNEIRNNLTPSYALQNNIDFLSADCVSYRSGAGWVPIGGDGTADQFDGAVDGQKHIISNLYINSVNHEVGLFDDAEDLGANISNLGLTNVDITGGDHTGGFVGSGGRYQLNISNAYTTGSITGGDNAGGLVGGGNDGSEGP